jgi:hypothetical protein
VIDALPAAANSGHQVRSARRARGRLLDEVVHEDGAHALGRGEHDPERVTLPGPLRVAIDATAPQVHDGPSLVVHAHRRADLAALREALREGVAHRRETRFDEAAGFHGPRC